MQNNKEISEERDNGNALKLQQWTLKNSWWGGNPTCKVNIIKDEILVLTIVISHCKTRAVLRQANLMWKIDKWNTCIEFNSHPSSLVTIGRPKQTEEEE